jgi:hypothetical protein
MHDALSHRPATHTALAGRCVALTVGAASLILVTVGSAVAAPVDSVETSAQAADPYELASRWTSQVLSSSGDSPLSAEAPAAPTAPRYTALPAAAQTSGVPDPRAYALMGALLLGVGLVARRLSGAQRGFSKKT